MLLYFYSVLIIVILLFCYIDYNTRKTNYQNIKKLNQQFRDWVQNDNAFRPSNAIFVKLYKEVYGEQNLTKNIPEVIAFGNIKYDNANILLSFPSKNEFILVEQLAILDNLEDYFTLEFQETKSIGYFIRTIVTLPLKLLKYLGFDEKSTKSKFFQLFWWILSLFLPIFKKLFLEFIDFLISRYQ